MAGSTETTTRSSAAEYQQMHETYCRGGLEHRMAPHAIYPDPKCPHLGCQQRLAGIDFRIAEFGKSVHDALLEAWWTDTGFAGRCPGCGQWVHFTIRGKRAIADAEAEGLPQLPSDWATHAFFL